jgi:hypothetical protein
MEVYIARCAEGWLDINNRDGVLKLAMKFQVHGMDDKARGQ